MELHLKSKLWQPMRYLFWWWISTSTLAASCWTCQKPFLLRLCLNGSFRLRSQLLEIVFCEKTIFLVTYVACWLLWILYLPSTVHPWFALLCNFSKNNSTLASRLARVNGPFLVVVHFDEQALKCQLIQNSRVIVRRGICTISIRQSGHYDFAK